MLCKFKLNIKIFCAGNPFPPLQAESHNYHYWLHNVLLEEAKKEFRSARAEKETKSTDPTTSEN